jgi:hypothetical protein
LQILQKTHRSWGGIHRLKQHLAGIRGQVTPCDAPDIGPIRLEMQNMFEKFEEDESRPKEIKAEIG